MSFVNIMESVGFDTAQALNLNIFIDEILIFNKELKDKSLKRKNFDELNAYKITVSKIGSEGFFEADKSNKLTSIKLAVQNIKNGIVQSLKKDGKKNKAIELEGLKRESLKESLYSEIESAGAVAGKAGLMATAPILLAGLLFLAFKFSK